MCLFDCNTRGKKKLDLWSTLESPIIPKPILISTIKYWKPRYPWLGSKLCALVSPRSYIKFPNERFLFFPLSGLGYFFVAATIPQKSGFTVQMTCGSHFVFGNSSSAIFSLSLALPFSTLRTSSPHIFINNIFQVQVRMNTKIDQDKNCKSIVVCKQKETNNVDKYDSQEAEESS